MSEGYTKERILEIAKNLIGKTFGEINSYSTKAELYNKGSHGHIIEEDVFQYARNSKSAPDFEEVGVELKVTPYKQNRDGSLSAKERLVLNIINYMNEYKSSFYTSHFWYKNKMMEIVWYKYEDGKSKSDFVITDALLFEFPKDDLLIIKSDWEYIISKIRDGKAHELSEADTMYLGACTKGTNASSVRRQPFSNILAKQRAFCLKTSYMTQLVRWYIGRENIEKVFPIRDGLCFSFEETLVKKLNKYKGKSVSELMSMFSVETQAKSLNEILLAKMLGVKGKISRTDEFLKANIVPKTIRLSNKNTIKESMSFPTFRFDKIITETWEESELYEMFSTTKFMFVIFKEDNDEYFFDGIKFWNMPNAILESEIKRVWEKTVEVIKNGSIVKKIIKDKRITNFPGISENEYCHVRPHGQNLYDTYPLPVTDIITGKKEYTKHCFWLNANYILSIIEDY